VLTRCHKIRLLQRDEAWGKIEEATIFGVAIVVIATTLDSCKQELSQRFSFVAILYMATIFAGGNNTYGVAICLKDIASM
jgi:hypothetical protein